MTALKKSDVPAYRCGLADLERIWAHIDVDPSRLGTIPTITDHESPWGNG